MDVYIHDIRMQIKLAEASARLRLAYLDDRPKGFIMRHNHIKHTTTLLTLLIELRVIASHDPAEWWDEKDMPPF